MKVILLGEIRGKGGEGDVVDVAQGYAENFLFPNKLALPATPGNIKQLEERRHNIAKREEKRLADAEAIRAAIDGKRVLVDAKIGEEGQLFGSVTGAMIAEAIEAQLGATVDRKRIDRTNTIKTAGIHEVAISLYREIGASIEVQVGDDETLAALAAAAERNSGAASQPAAAPATEVVAEETSEEAADEALAEPETSEDEAEVEEEKAEEE